MSYQSSGEASSDGTVAVITQTSNNLDAQTLDQAIPSENIREVSAEVIEGEASAVYIKMVVTNTALVSWGSSPAIGGALFSNAATISLVDTDLNLLSEVLSVGYDPYGIWGYAHLDEQITMLHSRAFHDLN